MDEKGKRVFLVTGATGFAGGHLAQYLLSEGIRVRALVRNPEKAATLAQCGAEIVKGDLTNRSDLQHALEGVHGVYHLAALFREARLPDSEYFRVNSQAVRDLFECAIQAGVKRVVHCSTVGVLGDVKNPPATEDAPYSPGDVYQRSKVEGEKAALEYLKSGRIGGAVIRPGMIWGPGDTRMLKLFKMIAARRFAYIGGGNALVHFVDVRDLARAFVLAMNHEEVNGDVFIIAGGQSVPLRKVVELIAEELGIPKPRLSIPARPIQLLGSICEAVCRPIGIEPPIYRRRVDFFTKNRSFDYSKARRMLGYNPLQNLKAEVRDCIAWYQAHAWISVCDYRKLQKRDRSVIVRDISGQIQRWSPSAEEFYGWESNSATGAVTHSLLKTEFPAPIEQINETLLKRKSWEGKLIHTRRNGSKIAVYSKWVLVPEYSNATPTVIETNCTVQENSDNHSNRSYGRQGSAASLMALHDALIPLL